MDGSFLSPTGAASRIPAEAEPHMSRERQPEAVVLQTPAKINLHLEIVGKRPDGYHDLETLMVAVDLYDELEFCAAEGSLAVTLTCDQAELSCGPDNLVHRAAIELRRRAGTAGRAKIHLRKRIPMQAGLAGGSSDAAATLIGLNRFWNLGLSTTELAEIGATIGSDVNFFLDGPCAWCTGRGEKVEPMKLGRPLDLVLATPPVGLSTAEVFQRANVPVKPQSGQAIRDAASRGDIDEIGRRLFNRLQEPAELLCPDIQTLRRQLEAANPLAVQMTGSGSTVFALCRDRTDAIRVASQLGAVVPGFPLKTAEGLVPAGASGNRWKLHCVRSCL
jgi:4-diphosphocytidyl-2-C-methyl-D-erythritol kinase